MICPDVLTLSQLLDGELQTPAAVRSHVDACPRCAERYARLQHAEIAARDAAHRALPRDAMPTSACLTPSQLVGWLDPSASAGERRAASEHLDGCDHCLAEALSAARTMTRLGSGPMHPVPDALAARVASRWDTGAPARSLTSLVVAVTRAGAELLERHLLAPFHDLVALPQPAAALRATADVTILQFELRADGTRIRTTVVPAGDAVDVSIVLVANDGAPLPAERVSLQRHGRAVFSARTDAGGRIAFPTLERGVYEVSCPGVSAAFRLDLRGAS